MRANRFQLSGLFFALLSAAAAYAAEPRRDEPPPPARSTQPLTSGAPLRDPNVAVHVVEKKPYLSLAQNELTLYPAAVQANPSFTEHVGTALGYTYRPIDTLAVSLLAQYNWRAAESAFNQELITKVREEAQAASSMLLLWGLQGGVEVAPIYGKMAFHDGTLVQFSFVLLGGAGIGGTFHQLRPSVRVCDEGGCRQLSARLGDTGVRALGTLGAGFRFQVGDRFALRLEFRDLIFGGQLDKVNGCNAQDLTALLPGGGGAGAVSAGCQTRQFEGVDPRTGDSRALDIPLALSLVQNPTSAVLNNLGFYAGVSYLF